MIGRSKLWLAAALYTIVNVAGAGYAAAMGEPLHAGVHVGLLLLGATIVWWFGPRRAARRDSHWGESTIPASPGPLTERLTNLEQSIDAVAIEVARIGEGQRLMTRVLVEQDTAQASSRRVAEPIEIKTDRSSS